MLSLKLQRRVRQESCESKVLVGGETTDVDVSIHAPRRIIIIRVNNRVPIGGARAIVLESSMPVTLWGRGIDRDHPIGAT